MRRGIHARVGRANLVEAVLDRALGEFGTVTVAAEVAEVDVLEIGGHEIGEDGGGGVVAEVAVATHDALLHAPGAFEVILQHFHVVICFQHQDVGVADAFHHELRGVAEIGEETDFDAVAAEGETDGIVGVVRDGKSFDPDIADFEGGAGAEEAEIEFNIFFRPIVFELKFDGFLGEAIAVNGNGQLAAERAEAVGVVGVLVREEDAAEAFGRAADLREAFANLFRAEAGIDQEPRVTAFEIGAIAIGTAAQDRELNRN